MSAIPQKIQVLKFVAEQGVVSVQDVEQHLSSSNKSSAIRVTMYQLGISHMKFPNVLNGVWYINNPKLYKLLKIYFPECPSFNIRPIVSYQDILHYLELNRIRNTLQNSKQIIIDEWWSEHCIRALPVSSRGCFSRKKIPDVIFWRKREDGTRQQFFLEYERNLKDEKCYENAFQFYARNSHVKRRNVIYICQDHMIREQLAFIENRMAMRGKLDNIGLYFQFVTLEGFYKTYKIEGGG